MKKITALLLVAAMLVVLVACGSDSDTSSKVESSAASSAVESSVASSEVESSVASSEAESSAESSVESSDTSDVSDVETSVMTYDEYVAAELQTEVVVETYVQAHQSWWDNKITVYCQSPDGAYFLYELACSEEDAAKLVPGTKIRVKGFKADFQGEVEITDGTFEFVEGGDTFIAEAIVLNDIIANEEDLIKYQNQLISFKGVTVNAISYKNGEPGDDIYLTLGYNGVEYNFCVEVYLTGVESEVYKTVGQLKVGDSVDVEGFLYWYQGANPHITAIVASK